MSKNIYIANIDTPLGYHMAQFYREDHLLMDPSTRIIGTASQSIQHPWIHATIDFQQQPQLVCRAILDCDVIVLDLRSPSHQAETIIKFLQHMPDNELKPIRIIGISSLMTWEGIRAFELQPEGDDKQTMITSILDESNWKPQIWKDSDYPKRIPNILWNKCYQLEQLLLKLNKKQKVKASVLGTGLIYGKENSMLQKQILQALDADEMTVWGVGNNKIPMVHVETVLEAVQHLIENFKDFTVLVQDNALSQQVIKEMIVQNTGNIAKLQRKELLNATEEQSFWSYQPHVKCSSIFDSFKSSRNFQEYCSSNLMMDICQYTSWTPCQFTLYKQEFQPQTLQAIVNQLKGKIVLITEQQIQELNLELIAKAMPAEQEIPSSKKQNRRVQNKSSLPSQDLQSQPPKYSQALQILLTPKKYTSFIIVCSNKIKEFIEKKYFLNEISEVVSEKKQEIKHQLVYASKEWYETMKIEKPIDAEESESEREKNENKSDQKNVYEGDKNLQKDSKMILTTQYLLDNVLGALSEAKFTMNSKGTSGLDSLISELKNIYDRGNYKSLLDKENVSVGLIKEAK